MRLPTVLLVLCASFVTVGCAASNEEGAASSDAALTEYESVKRDGTKVESDTRPNATRSASTRLVGYIPARTISDVAGRLLKVDRWTEIKGDDGTKPFLRASVKSDKTSAGVRTVDANVTLEDDIPLELRAAMRSGPDKTIIQFTNTTGYAHWLAGKILEPGKLVLEAKLVALDDGVIVDVTMSVKLEKMEEKAAPICAAVPLVFDWLAR